MTGDTSMTSFSQSASLSRVSSHPPADISIVSRWAESGVVYKKREDAMMMNKNACLIVIRFFCLIMSLHVPPFVYIPSVLYNVSVGGRGWGESFFHDTKVHHIRTIKEYIVIKHVNFDLIIQKRRMGTDIKHLTSDPIC